MDDASDYADIEERGSKAYAKSSHPTKSIRLIYERRIEVPGKDLRVDPSNQKDVPAGASVELGPTIQYKGGEISIIVSYKKTSASYI
ncbi:hypothetical protein [Mesorhizobium sp.]|uniref:hypothetical protein n=1 Tax=Mesorhizobium sp. TaxID=1871066 RepID=UPI000FE7E7A7|nr:hypothetical protein [Mesorhizobium sp.]RWQ65054.1 MAG: hypothetical protein EOS86_17305 [Mesorhizobium sp.]